MIPIILAASTAPELVELTDGDLILRAQEGNQTAFSELVRRYHQRLFNMLYALVSDRDDADDLAQETFLRAYRSLSGFQGRSQFYTWLYRMGINCWKDWIKSPRHPSKHQNLDDYVEGQDEIDPRAPEATDRTVVRRELNDLLMRALGELPEEYRATVILREIEGLGYEDIAEALTCSVGTVKSRLFRARTQLKQLWQTRYRAHWEGH